MRVLVLRSCLRLALAVCLCGAGLGGWSSRAAAAGLAEVVARVDPAVVLVLVVEKRFTESESASGGVSYNRGLGSGVIISRKGLVLTAAHVVSMAEAVGVKLWDGKRVPAKVVGSAPLADVALLQLDPVPDGLQAVRLGDSSRLRVGDQVFVLGAPYGAEHTLTVGYVSARRKVPAPEGGGKPVVLIQTDAAINQGNSGGPMFNLQGEVVGVVSHILSRSGGFEGLGFAVASNTARRLLLEQQTIWLGMEFVLLDQKLSRLLNLPTDHGLLVQRVAGNSLAHRLGLKGGTVPVKLGRRSLLLGGDVVLEIMGRPVGRELADVVRLRRLLVELPAGAKVSFKVFRQGKTVTLRGTK